MHLTARGPVPVAGPLGRVTWGTSEDPGTGLYNPSTGLMDFYANFTKAYGVQVTSSNPTFTGYTGHLNLVTDTDSKQVRLNARNYTQATGDTIGFSTIPNQTVTTTGEVYGAQIKPRIAAGINAATCNGMEVDSEVKSGAGVLSGDLRGVQIYLGATGSGTIGGNICVFRARCESNINPSGRIVFAHIVNHEGSQGWDGLLEFTEALGTHSMTTNSDKTGNTKSGTIKIYANATLYHLQLYSNS